MKRILFLLLLFVNLQVAWRCNSICLDCGTMASAQSMCHEQVFEDVRTTMEINEPIAGQCGYSGPEIEITGTNGRQSIPQVSLIDYWGVTMWDCISSGSTALPNSIIEGGGSLGDGVALVETSGRFGGTMDELLYSPESRYPSVWIEVEYQPVQPIWYNWDMVVPQKKIHW